MEDKNENIVSTETTVNETLAESEDKTIDEEEKITADEEMTNAEMTNAEETNAEEMTITAGDNKLTSKERRERWKAAKKARRQEQKEYYKYAPWPVRIWSLYLKVPVIIILVICLIAVFVYEPVYNFFVELYDNSINSYYMENKDLALSEEDRARIYELSPIDEKGSRDIDAFPAIGENETWTICVYVVGSDLEDQYEVDLAPVTSVKADKLRTENNEKQIEESHERLDKFENELALEGLELPSFYYYPLKPVESSTYVTQDVVVESGTGCASLDIAEITSGIWSDNIRVVIQPGGATHWSNHRINPNRTQRFVYENGLLEEVANLPLQPAGDPDTLTDFLKFCDKNYHSDHNMLVFWDHGAGPFGFGNDTIYGTDFSLKEIRSGLEKAYGRNPSKAPYDIIGFDACLMSSIEVTHALNGYARYYCLSQESEPGEGWDYGAFLQAMTDNPTMSAPQVGRSVADSYTDYYMTENINVGDLYTCNTTFSVLDAKKSEELYKAYSDLCKAQLKDAAKNMGVLANVGRCANESTRYGADYSDMFNLVDLGNYAEKMSRFYPAECEKVSKLVDEAVLYHRENGSVCDATGISVYLPADVCGFYGLYYYIWYVYDICEDDNIRALYYYKQAGCLNKELSGYVEDISGVKPRPLDVKSFADFTKSEPVIEDSGFCIPVSEELSNLVVGYDLVMSELDEVANTITELGSIGGVSLEDEEGFVSSFEGMWPTIDGTPMYVDIVSNTESATEYRAHVMYNGQEAYLMLNQNHLKDELTITGVRMVDDMNPNYMVNTKTLEAVEEYSTIVPLYLETSLYDGSEYLIEGRKLTLKKNTKVRMEPLPSGYYLGSVVITDPRGDSYYSTVLGANADQNGIEEWCVDDRFVGSDY